MRILRPLLRDMNCLWSVALLLLLLTLLLLSASASIVDASTPPRPAPPWVQIPALIALGGFLLTAGAALGLSLIRAARALARHRS
jgi:hypothetical protein